MGVFFEIFIAGPPAAAENPCGGMLGKEGASPLPSRQVKIVVKKMRGMAPGGPYFFSRVKFTPSTASLKLTPLVRGLT